MMQDKNSFDIRTIFAIAICLMIWFGWQKHLENKYPPQTVSPQKTGASEKVEVKTPPLSKIQVVEEKEIKTWVFENNHWKVNVSSLGGKISEVTLKRFTSSSKDIEELTPSDKGLLNVFVEADKGYDFSNVNFSMNSPTADTLVLTGAKEGILVKKTYKFFPENFLVRASLEVSCENKELKKVSIVSSLGIKKQEEKRFSFLSFGPSTENYQEYYFFHKNKKEREVIKPNEDFNKEVEQLQIAALGSRYFTNLFINKSNVMPNAVAKKDSSEADLTIWYPVLDPQNKYQVYNFELFAGPKSIKVLSEIDSSAVGVVDYGMFSVIAIPLLRLMKWFYTIVGNYGLAIILLTFFVRTLTFPFTYMSYKSMKAMQVLQPEIARLKTKYKGDTQTFNTEMMKLYKENKINPMGGCLPMLLQLPVFWALYQVLQNSIELYQAPFYLWIHDLSQKDPYYVMPVLMGITMFIQQKITPSTMDPAQAKMMLIMPIFFSLLMFGLPSGLTLYIFVSTLFGIIQQFIIMKDRAPKVQAAVLKSN